MEEGSQSKETFCSFVDGKARFSELWKVGAHLCKHTGLRPFSCDRCDKSFCTANQLTRHHRSGEKPYHCLLEGCSEAFATLASMKDHMAQTPQQKKRYDCDRQGCEKTFNKRNQLKAHEYEHTQLLPSHCSLGSCTMEFSSHNKLRHHERLHDGYGCDEDACTVLGQTWTGYQTHKKKPRRTAELQASMCKKQFLTAWFLHQHHMHFHTGERRLFRCPKEECDKTFKRLSTLKNHVLGDHEGRKAPSCAYPGCEKSFPIKESLWRHGVVHDPAKRKLQNLHPKNNQPWSKARRVAAVAASTAVETKLAAMLANVKLNTDP
ncbi:LOW QUALITY PROTEIN: general transcription factor IIIA, b [Lampris incognitus]|uniref:LOW QUALITY PROTEIN: general transcription factor IIIA, b n=1 Tax=Lampris incognitus TaxID=2546036 RepID=UPI0024B5F207|nr:LOW QUALITY PROTEIN: general transcription factor IIIA, b [Lampris incognitus]